MFATLYYGKHVLGCEVFVIDSLMKMSDISEESLEKQKLFVDRLAVTCRDLNIHVFLVAHTRKMKSEDEIPDATNIMGSSHIRNLTDNVICVWRNRAKEKLVEEGKTPEEELKIIPDAKVFVQKARNSQWEGSFNFWYDAKGLKYKESPNAR
jgi:twinkle protein